MPWWDENCREAVKSRNKAFRQFKKHHSLETLIQYNKLQAVVRGTIRTAKRDYWRQYCNKIVRETQVSEIWGMIRKMSGIRRNNIIPVLISNGKTAVNNTEKAELLAETQVKVHSLENISMTAKQFRANTLAQNKGMHMKKSITNDSLDLPFTLFELRRASLHSRQSAPGKEGICYSRGHQPF